MTALQRLEIAQAEWKKVLNPNATPGVPVVNREIALTTPINMQTNVTWGDELKEKAEDTIRIFAANVNGFTLDRRGGQYDNYCRVLKAAQVDIACGQEHNLDTTKSAVRSIIHNTTTLASTPWKFENLYKPGGTFIMSVGSITSRMSDRYQDKWGRWASQTFRGRAGQALVTVYIELIIGLSPSLIFVQDLSVYPSTNSNSSYQVLVTDNPARGTTTAAAQQYSLLLQARERYTQITSSRIPSQLNCVYPTLPVVRTRNTFDR